MSKPFALSKPLRTTIKVAGWGTSFVLIFAILTGQLFLVESIPIYTKIGVPTLLVTLLGFFLGYKYIRSAINQKVTAIETAQILGRPVPIKYIVLSDFMTALPVALTAGLFFLVGQFAMEIAWILVGCLLVMQLGFIGDIIAQIGENGAIAQEEEARTQANNEAIAKEVQKLLIPAPQAKSDDKKKKDPGIQVYKPYSLRQSWLAVIIIA